LQITLGSRASGSADDALAAGDVRGSLRRRRSPVAGLAVPDATPAHTGS
jgi:hypothetical protein